MALENLVINFFLMFLCTDTLPMEIFLNGQILLWCPSLCMFVLKLNNLKEDCVAQMQ